MNEYFPGRPPAPKQNFEDAPEVANQLDPDVKQTLKYINRGSLGIPNHALRAAAYQYSGQCDKVNKEFMLCKLEEGDARKCLKYGDKVSVCAEDFFRTITETCQETFVGFAKCLEYNVNRVFAHCRKEQLAFDTCLYEKLGYDKPRHLMVRDTKIKTDRPAPKNPYNFQPNIDTRRHPVPDFFERPLGDNRVRD